MYFHLSLDSQSECHLIYTKVKATTTVGTYTTYQYYHVSLNILSAL